ncbi:2-hydroxyacyl-CoA dehydratase subunit D [Chloroflexota bacterium]
MESEMHRLTTQTTARQLTKQHYDDLKQARDAGKRVVWCTGDSPAEICLAMDFIWLCPETHAILAASKGASRELCEIAEERGYSPDICSWIRIDLGSIFSGGSKSPVGGLPKPDLLYTTTACHQRTMWFKELSALYDVPLLVLNIPHMGDHLGDEETTAGARYMVQQLKEHITFLEQFTGRPYDWGRLQEHIDLTGKAARLFGQLAEMGKHIPSPITCFDLFGHIGLLHHYRGLPQAADIYQLAVAEAEERVRRGVSAVGEEKFRLYWDNIPVWFALGDLSRKFLSYGACLALAYFPFSLIDRFSVLDPERPLESISEAHVTWHYNMGTSKRIERLAKMISEYSIDGLVMQMSQTCKMWNMDSLGMANGLREKTGLPSVTIEGDMGDPRLFSIKDIYAQIVSFMELLAKLK